MIIPAHKNAHRATPVIPESGDPLMDAPPSFEEAIASSSTAPPQTSAAGRSSYIPEVLPSGSPPEFSSYHSEYTRTSNGDIVSHDSHLNEDGEALYRFILEHLDAPRFKLHVRGSHKEQRVRVVNHHHHHNHNGPSGVHSSPSSHHSSGHRVQGNTELEEVTVTEFDFFIDLSILLAPGPERAEIFTIDHNVPGYRGKMVKQVSHEADTKAPNDEEQQASSRSANWRRQWRPNAFQRFGDRLSQRDGQGSVRLPEGELDSNALLERTDAEIDAAESGSEHPHWRKAMRKERKITDKHARWVSTYGLPPWTSMSAYLASNVPSEQQTTKRLGVVASSSMLPPMSIRDWADDYCRSEMMLKEFKFKKVVYGWDFKALITSIEDHIRSMYKGDISVTFETSGALISIRPSTTLSRAMSNIWLCILMWLTLIYPFLWLFRRFHPRGGGKWEICGAGYSLKSRSQNVNQIAYGMKEGEWYKMWQSTITHGVRARVKSTEPLSCHGNPETTLDGYVA